MDAYDPADGSPFVADRCSHCPDRPFSYTDGSRFVADKTVGVRLLIYLRLFSYHLISIIFSFKIISINKLSVTTYWIFSFLLFILFLFPFSFFSLLLLVVFIKTNIKTWILIWVRGIWKFYKIIYLPPFFSKKLDNTILLFIALCFPFFFLWLDGSPEIDHSPSSPLLKMWCTRVRHIMN